MISRLTLNLECVFRIECQQVQGHHEIIRVFLGGLASKLELVIAMEHRTSSRSSGYLLLDWTQTSYMQSRLRAEQVQGHPKVI